MTQAVLRATIAAAHARGAKAIVLVPQYLPEAPVEKTVRRQVLDQGGIPYLLVPLAPSLRSPAHGHPTAQGARVLAEAISESLHGAEYFRATRTGLLSRQRPGGCHG